MTDKEFRARMNKIRDALNIISTEINLLYCEWSSNGGNRKN
jgi:hypothetical protein